MWESAVTSEPISPELVLVDPQLAARVRSQPEAHRLFTPRCESASLELAAAPVRARNRVPPGLVMFAGGLLALIGVTFALSEWPPGVSRPVLSRQAGSTAAVKVTRTTAVQQ